MKTSDIIIVGQGIAGSILSICLLEAGYSVQVIDKPDLSLSSKVAAGIWNPVVFKRLTKSWMVDKVLPDMLRFYGSCEKKFNVPLITERNILKIFSEQQEADLWIKKAESELKDYIDHTVYYDKIRGSRTTAFGYSKVLKAGNLNVTEFLSKTREMLEHKGNFLNETFDFTALDYKDEVRYKDLRSARIIFAEGYMIKNNPIFNYIPFKPAKGEVLTVKCDRLETGKDILNKNLFVMPLGNKKFKVGATYDWQDLNDTITETAKKELEEKLGKLVTAEHEILMQEAGVRPSVTDRRPVIGKHPKHSNILVFNGMGTKGVMLAPYFAKHLTEHLLNGTTINPEVDVQRFNKFFVN